MEKNDVVHIQKLMLMQPTNGGKNNRMVMILVPFYVPRSRMPDLGGQTFQTSPENRSCGPTGIPNTSAKESENGQDEHLQVVVPRSSVPQTLYGI